MWGFSEGGSSSIILPYYVNTSTCVDLITYFLKLTSSTVVLSLTILSLENYF